MENPHSQAFIAEMSKRLEEEKKHIEQELGRVARSVNGEYVANLPDYGRDEEENANESADFDSAQATTQALEARLEEIGVALQSVAEGAYGLTKSGEVIPEDRLRANPAARTVIKHS